MQLHNIEDLHIPLKENKELMRQYQAEVVCEVHMINWYLYSRRYCLKKSLSSLNWVFKNPIVQLVN